MSKFKKGDKVSTPPGVEAEVNWVKDGKVGVTFLEEDHKGGMVFNSDELQILERALHVPREDKPLQEMSISELREAIRNLRNGRKESIQGSRTKSKSKSTARKATSKSKKKKKKDPLSQVKGTLPPHLVEKLQKKMNEKEGDG